MNPNGPASAPRVPLARKGAATPAARSPKEFLAKPVELTGALVQRGRERAFWLMETSLPMEIAEPEPAPHALPAPVPRAQAPELQAPAPVPELHAQAPQLRAPLATAQASRRTNVVFAAACCVAFFAIFLFALRC